MKCTRCWKCCVRARDTTLWITMQFMKSMCEPWLQIDSNPDTRICPFLTINESYQPHCIIYHERPTVCRNYMCTQIEWYKP